MKFLIVALGNIGLEYKYTRHNIGFLIADRLSSKHGFTYRTDRLADVAQFRIKNKQVTLIKPTTYMNLSGKAYKYWLEKLEIPLEHSMAIVDDLALDLGVLRIKTNGSPGGHNGLISIEQELQVTGYPRLRFGIGRGFLQGGQVDYVLGKWSDEELEKLPPYLDRAIEAVEECILAGLTIAMNKFNQKI